MLLMKRRDHPFNISLEKQVELLRDQNVKLKDSLLLQSSALEKQKKQKQTYIGKYLRLEKEKVEAVKRCQELLLLLIKNNINFDNDPFGTILNIQTPKKTQQRKTSKQAASNPAITRQSSNVQQIAPNSRLLTKILQSQSQLGQKRQSNSPLKRTSFQIRKSSSKLLTLKQVSRQSKEPKQISLESTKNSVLSKSRRRLSYVQKIHQGLA